MIVWRCLGLASLIVTFSAFAGTTAITTPAATPPQPAPAAPTSVTTTVTNTPTQTSTTTTVDPNAPDAPATTSTAVDTTSLPATPSSTTTIVVPTQTTVPQSNLSGTDDRTIRETIAARLRAQPILAGADITVISSGGIVTLSGNAITQAQIDAAIAISQSAVGVKEVRSDIVLQNP